MFKLAQMVHIMSIWVLEQVLIRQSFESTGLIHVRMYTIVGAVRIIVYSYTSVDAASALEISTQYGTVRNKFICPNHAPIYEQLQYKKMKILTVMYRSLYN